VKRCSDLFGFDIFIARWLGGQFFIGRSILLLLYHLYFLFVVRSSSKRAGDMLTLARISSKIKGVFHSRAGNNDNTVL